MSSVSYYLPEEHNLSSLVGIHVSQLEETAYRSCMFFVFCIVILWCWWITSIAQLFLPSCFASLLKYLTHSLQTGHCTNSLSPSFVSPCFSPALAFPTYCLILLLLLPTSLLSIVLQWWIVCKLSFIVKKVNENFWLCRKSQWSLLTLAEKSMKSSNSGFFLSAVSPYYQNFSLPSISCITRDFWYQDTKNSGVHVHWFPMFKCHDAFKV